MAVGLANNEVDARTGAAGEFSTNVFGTEFGSKTPVKRLLKDVVAQVDVKLSMGGIRNRRRYSSRTTGNK